MTISGGIKFFERSSALYSSGTTATADYNSAAANNILTNRQLTYYVSVGANSDTTTVTITVTYNKTVTIDRIILNRHNFKSFTVKYDVTGTPTDFTNVVGLDGALAGGISETSFSDETAYYEVDSVSTTGLTITATATQTADAEKMLYNLFTTAELGTLQQYPKIEGLQFSRNEKTSAVLSGRAQIQKAYKTKSFSLNFQVHPSQSDMDLVSTLLDESDSFLVWLCGGRRGTNYFRYELEGYRLRDIFNMQVSGAIDPSYPGSIYVVAPNNSISFVESV